MEENVLSTSGMMLANGHMMIHSGLTTFAWRQELSFISANNYSHVFLQMTFM